MTQRKQSGTVVKLRVSGDFGVLAMVDDNISLLGEELVLLSIKSSVIEPKGLFCLLCSLWTKKNFNPDSFKAQMKSIWKSNKKYVIEMVRQNLFLISFDSECDMERIMEGRPWFL